MKKPSFGIPIACALVLAGCAHPQTTSSATAANAPPPSPPALEPSASPGAPPAQATSPASPSSGALVADNGPAAPEPQPTLTDDQILGVTRAANIGEITQGELALSKANDPRVKKLATMMVHDHTAAQNKGDTVAKAAKLQPAGSPVAASLEQDASGVTQSLKSQAAASFDRAYVDSQVSEHQSVLDTIDQKLLPSVKNADLKAYLDDVRAAVSTHLAHAKELQHAMQGQ